MEFRAWAAVVASSLAACSFNSQGTGMQQGETSGAGGSTTTSTGTTATATAGTNTTATTTSPTTSSSSTTGGSTGIGDTDIAPGDLVSRGVLVRYFLDEGEGLDVFDDADDPLDLVIEPGNGQPTWTADPQRGGLAYTAEEADGLVLAAIGGTKIESRLQGTTTLTIEGVIDVVTTSDEASRLLHGGPPGTTNSDFGFDMRDSGVGIRIRTTADEGRKWPGNTIIGRGRIVVHAVLDTTAGDANERAILYIDGERQTPNDTDTPVQGAVVPISADADFVLFNRTDGSRSFVGTGYYAAIYDVALTSAEVATNAARLLANDDR